MQPQWCRSGWHYPSIARCQVIFPLVTLGTLRLAGPSIALAGSLAGIFLVGVDEGYALLTSLLRTASSKGIYKCR